MSKQRQRTEGSGIILPLVHLQLLQSFALHQQIATSTSNITSKPSHAVALPAPPKSSRHRSPPLPHHNAPPPNGSGAAHMQRSTYCGLVAQPVQKVISFNFWGLEVSICSNTVAGEAFVSEGGLYRHLGRCGG